MKSHGTREKAKSVDADQTGLCHPRGQSTTVAPRRRDMTLTCSKDRSPPGSTSGLANLAHLLPPDGHPEKDGQAHGYSVDQGHDAANHGSLEPIPHRVQQGKSDGGLGRSHSDDGAKLGRREPPDHLGLAPAGALPLGDGDEGERDEEETLARTEMSVNLGVFGMQRRTYPGTDQDGIVPADWLGLPPLEGDTHGHGGGREDGEAHEDPHHGGGGRRVGHGFVAGWWDSSLWLRAAVTEGVGEEGNKPHCALVVIKYCPRCRRIVPGAGPRRDGWGAAAGLQLALTPRSPRDDTPEQLAGILGLMPRLERLVIDTRALPYGPASSLLAQLEAASPPQTP